MFSACVFNCSSHIWNSTFSSYSTKFVKLFNCFAGLDNKKVMGHKSIEKHIQQRFDKMKIFFVLNLVLPRGSA